MSNNPVDLPGMANGRRDAARHVFRLLRRRLQQEDRQRDQCTG